MKSLLSGKGQTLPPPSSPAAAGKESFPFLGLSPRPRTELPEPDACPGWEERTGPASADTGRPRPSSSSSSLLCFSLPPRGDRACPRPAWQLPRVGAPPDPFRCQRRRDPDPSSCLISGNPFPECALSLRAIFLLPPSWWLRFPAHPSRGAQMSRGVMAGDRLWRRGTFTHQRGWRRWTACWGWWLTVRTYSAGCPSGCDGGVMVAAKEGKSQPLLLNSSSIIQIEPPPATSPFLPVLSPARLSPPPWSHVASPTPYIIESKPHTRPFSPMLGSVWH